MCVRHMRRLDLSVYVITDRHVGRGRSHEEMTAAAIAGGATVVQLRDKTATTRQLVDAASRMLALTRQAGVPLIINDRVDVALGVDADGAHVGQDDLPASIARRLLGPGKILGVSAGTEAEAVAAERDGADYVGVGPVFEALAKADAGPPIGVDTLRRIVRVVRIPVVAIGGILHEHAPELIRAGAAGVAVINAVFAEPDIITATRRLVEVVRAGQR